MANTTINHNSPQLLLTTSENPLYILAGVTVGGSSYAIYGKSSQAWSVTNSGTLAATGTGLLLFGNGVNVENSGTAAHINSVGDGVVINGSNALVLNQGTITGTEIWGVDIGGGGVVINSGAAADISGGDDAVFAEGTADVFNQGTMSGGYAGVDITTGLVSNSGTAASISGGNSGVVTYDSPVTIINQGGITGTGTASNGVYFRDGGTVTNMGAAAAITGARIGVYANNGTAAVYNHGTISGTGTNGSGVLLLHGGTVMNDGTGALISGGQTGVLAKYSPPGGLAPSFYGPTTVINQGTISGTGTASTGVRLGSGGVVTNSGTAAHIKGTLFGVVAAYSASTVTNQGTITGTDDVGVGLGAGGTVANCGVAALITSGGIGVDAIGGPATVLNQGNISGLANYGVSLSDGGTVSNSGTGASISGGEWGVYTYNRDPSYENPTTVTNDGTISGVAGAVRFDDVAGNVFALAPGAVTNGVVDGTGVGNTLELDAGPQAGFISGLGTEFTGFDVLAVEAAANWRMTGAEPLSASATIILGGSGTLWVAGNLTAPYNLTMAGTGTLAAAAGGRIEIGIGNLARSGQIVVDAAQTLISSGVQSAGAVLNFGTISGASGYGLHLGTATTVTNSGTARITGAQYGLFASAGVVTLLNQGMIAGTSGDGVHLGAGGAVTNNATGTISGGQNGVYAGGGAATVTNQGSITGASGYGVLLAAGGSVTNSGTKADIAGGETGVGAQNSVATIVNQGTITGTLMNGVYFGAGGAVANSGTGASIKGGQWGVYVAGNSATVTNQGTITGATGAVHFANANGNLFEDIPGAVTNGVVAGGTGTDTLELGSGASAGTITGIGSLFTGFERVLVDTGAVWSLTGANTLLSTTVIGVFGTLNVNGALTEPANLTVYGTGTLAAAGGHVEVGTAGTASADEVAVDAAHTLSLSGGPVNPATIAGTVANAGEVLVTGAHAAMSGPLTGAGTVQVNSAATLALNGATNATATMVDTGAVNLGTNDGLTVSGTATVRGTLHLSGGTLHAGSLTLTSTGALTGFGSVTNAIANAGRVEANGGTLTVSGAVTGAGTLQPDSGATLALNGTSNSAASVLDNGTLTLGASDSLDVSASVNSASAGLFVLTNASLLEVAADTGAGNQISFLGASGDKLIVDAVASFGTNVGLSTYTGPKLENFGTLDTIDLKNLVFSGATIDSYTAATGLLQLQSGTTKATLLFDNATLGSGSFHLAADSGTGTVLTHS